MHTYTICIGTNDNRKENLLLAQQQLTVLFPFIRFAKEEETKPFLLHNPAPFINQVARFEADEDVACIKEQLKSIELLAGRRPEDKVIEKVMLDIDLLMCDEVVLKPNDMLRDYIIRGIRQLNACPEP